MELIGPSSRDVRGKQDYRSWAEWKASGVAGGGGGEAKKDRVYLVVSGILEHDGASSVYRALQGLRKIVGALER